MGWKNWQTNRLEIHIAEPLRPYRTYCQQGLKCMQHSFRLPKQGKICGLARVFVSPRLFLDECYQQGHNSMLAGNQRHSPTRQSPCESVHSHDRNFRSSHFPRSIVVCCYVCHDRDRLRGRAKVSRFFGQRHARQQPNHVKLPRTPCPGWAQRRRIPNYKDKASCGAQNRIERRVKQ